MVDLPPLHPQQPPLDRHCVSRVAGQRNSHHLRAIHRRNTHIHPKQQPRHPSPPQTDVIMGVGHNFLIFVIAGIANSGKGAEPVTAGSVPATDEFAHRSLGAALEISTTQHPHRS